MRQDRQYDPHYYAIIPAEVRYNKKLPPSAKLLYGEITALSNQRGFCWASNAYFAELYGVEIRTIQRWISLLREYDFVKCLGKMKDGRRRLRVTKMSWGGGDKNVTHNNTRLFLSKDKNGKRGKDVPVFHGSTKKGGKLKKRKRLGKGSPSTLSPVMEIVEHWKSKPRLMKPKPQTVKKIKKHLKKNVLPKYSVDQVKRAIDNFSNETIIKTTITAFFIVSDYHRVVNKTKMSYFEIYLDSELSKLGRKIQINYNHNFLTDNVTNSKKQIQDFNNAANKLIKFIKKKHLEKVGQEGSRIDYIFLLFGAVEDAFGDQVVTGNLCSDYTFDTLMPKYIRKIYGTH